MKIKNLKINKNVKKLATCLLVGTISFSSVKFITTKMARDDMPEYSIEKLVATKDGDEITISKEEDTYSPVLFKDDPEKPKSKILEYNNWKEKEEHFERKIDIYETDVKKRVIKEILKSKLSTADFLNKTSHMTEKTKKLPDDDNIYKEAYFYKYHGTRELTDKEKEGINKLINRASLFVGIATILFECATYEIVNPEDKRKKREEEKVKVK